MNFLCIKINRSIQNFNSFNRLIQNLRTPSELEDQISEKNIKNKAQLQAAFTKLEGFSHNSQISQYKSVFQALKAYKVQAEHVPKILRLASADQSPSSAQKKTIKKLLKSKSSSEQSPNNTAKRSIGKTSYGLLTPTAASSIKKPAPKSAMTTFSNSPVSRPSNSISSPQDITSVSPKSQVSGNKTVKASSTSNFTKTKK